LSRPLPAVVHDLDLRRAFRRPDKVQFPGHSHREGPLSGQDVGCALTRAEQAAKIGLGITACFHSVPDRIDRLGRFDRPAPALVVLDDQREKIETIGFRGARLRFDFEVPLSLSATS